MFLMTSYNFKKYFPYPFFVHSHWYTGRKADIQSSWKCIFEGEEAEAHLQALLKEIEEG